MKTFVALVLLIATLVAEAKEAKIVDGSDLANRLKCIS